MSQLLRLFILLKLWHDPQYSNFNTKFVLGSQELCVSECWRGGAVLLALWPQVHAQRHCQMAGRDPPLPQKHTGHSGRYVKIVIIIVNMSLTDIVLKFAPKDY